VNRRQAILAVLALAAGPVHAQKVHRVGFLGAESASGYRSNVEAFRSGLRELGLVEGKNAVIEFRWADGAYDRLPELAEQLVRMKVDVVVTHGAPGTRAAKRATTTIPIVMASAGDASATGLVMNLARPEGNVTGSTFFAPEVGAKRLDILKEAIPSVARVAWIFVPDNPITPEVRRMVETAAKALKVALDQIAVRDAKELESVFSAIAARRVDAVLVPEYSLFRAHAASIASMAARQRLPTMGFTELADAGGLLGYGIDDRGMFRRAAVFVSKIIKGANPAELPVERATTFQLVVNRRVARQLGVSITDGFMVRADRVIE